MGIHQFYSGAMRLAPRNILTGAPPGDSLGNVNTSNQADGCLCWVRSAQTDFRLLLSSALPPDGVNVIQPIAGPGQWIRLTNGTSITPLSRTFFVDGTTTIPVPQQDGSIAEPFSTIGQAIAAVTGLPVGAPAAIFVGPGTYTEQVLWPERTGLIVMGAGDDQTLIVAPAGLAALRVAPSPIGGALVRRLDVRDLTVVSLTGERCVEIISTTLAPAVCLGDGAFFDRVNLRAAPGTEVAFASRAGGLYVVDSWWASSVALGGAGDERTMVQNCTTALFSRCRLGHLQTEYIDTNPQPGTGRSIYQIDTSTQVETRWTMTGHPVCAAAPGTFIRGTSGVVPTVVATGLTNGASHAPQVFLSGLVGNPDDPGSGNVDIWFPSQTGAPAPAKGALIGGTFTGVVTVQVVGGAARVVVPAYQATFANPAAGAVTAGVLTDLDLRDAKFEQSALATLGAGVASGAIDRTLHVVLPPVALPIFPAPAVAVSISPPLPIYVGGLYAVQATQVGAPVAGPVISAQVNTGFSAQGGGAGGLAVFTVIRP